MRVVLFHPAFETVGGAEILAAEQAQALRARGDEVRIVTFSYDPGRWANRFEGLPVDLIRKRHWRDLFISWDRIAKLRARGRRAQVRLRDAEVVLAYNYPCNAMLGRADTTARKVWQCNEPPRSLHLPEANPALFRRAKALREDGSFEDLASREFQRALLDYEEDLERDGKISARRRFDLESCAGLDAIFAISGFSRDNARRIYGRCNEEVVYPAVRFPGTTRTRTGLDRSGLQVLVHSRLEAFKNIDTVIRGFHRFRARHGSGCRLHVVGEGPCGPALKALAAELFPEGGVQFHGYLPLQELQSVYAACDVFTLLTLDEPFGLVFPEAAARGLSLIGPDHGGPLEILEGGRLGQAVDAFSPEALADALERVWKTDDADLERQREAADRSCRARFSLEAVLPPLVRALAG